ncbi:nucleic acid-binding protein [Leptolyngbya sp. Heron Island J]|uniref:hypothetical protein n=1 Tax=Leptolyngbya sp. Heron Island J TaxID=1385935 RepID=UPI0003B9CEDF|nr:hypothetical protein [Leptolyngbya sp. Heron Island J]ESA36930.1 nucleic acid-binding protein [Leptolyngbya sp. Heron Island J]
MQPPDWLKIKTVLVTDKKRDTLDPGEQTAITLAQTLPADLLIIDERLGRRVASEKNLNSLIFLLPPLEEQKLIVQKIYQIFDWIEPISDSVISMTQDCT